MCNSSLFYALALTLIACTAPTLANLPNGALGFLGGGVASPIVEQCAKGIRGVEGCIQELISSFISRQPNILGPACCKALLQIDQTCLPKMFPFQLGFLPNLKNNCVGGDDSPTTLDYPPPPPPLPCNDCEGGDDDPITPDVPSPPPCSDDDDEGEDCDYDNDNDN